MTICTAERAALFGEIAGEEMRSNEAGEVVRGCWLEIPLHFPNVILDEFVIMPNHVHGILMINVGARHAVPLHDATSVPAAFGKPIASSAPTIIGSFKSAATRRINETRGTSGAAVWQRNYYEHVVRGDRDLDRIRQYIANNPASWAEDELNPANKQIIRPP